MPCCEAVGPKGPCKMRPLRGERLCFIHSPSTAAARSAARAKGGDRRHRAAAAISAPTATAATVPLAPLPFDFNFTRRSEIGSAVLKVSRAIAEGTIDPRRGRLLIDSLRTALAAFEGTNGSGDDDVIPSDGREPTAAEMRYIVDNEGRLPPGVSAYPRQRPFLVMGAVWEPSPAGAVPVDPN